MTKLALVGEAFGAEEEKIGVPFVGVSGQALLQMLNEAGILQFTDYDKSMLKSYWGGGRDSNYIALIWKVHPEIFCTNVFMLHPKGNDLDTLCVPKKEAGLDLPPLRPGKYIQSQFIPHIDNLLSALRRESPNLVIALGNTAAWAILQNSGISKIRGAVADSVVIPGLKVLPTYHPAAILRQWDLRAVTILDLMKAKRELEFPEIRRPERTVYIEPALPDLEWFCNEHLANATRIAVDIETYADQITCIGFAPSTSLALVVPFVDNRKENGSYWNAVDEPQAWAWVKKVCESRVPKVMQNGTFDSHRLWRGYGIRCMNMEDDTMLLQHSLQPEMLKGLGFLGSIYTNESSWKLMTKHNKTIKRDD